MYSYEEVSELKLDLELLSIDLEGAIGRIAISVDAHSDLLEKEELSDESKLMMKHLAESSEILSTLIGHLNAISIERAL